MPRAPKSPRPVPEVGEERFRLLVESVKDYGIFMLDSSGHITTWNEGAQRLTGYTTSEILGQHFSVFYPREDVAAGKCERELDVATREGRFEEEGARLRKDGTPFWASVTITALFGAGGELVGFAKVSRDLTERRIAQQEAQRFRLLVESVKDYAIFMLDPQGRVATWNIGAQRLKGYSAKEVIGQHFSRFYPREDVEAGKCERELEIATTEGRFEEEGFRLRKDGTPFWASVTITAVRDHEGQLVGFAKVTRDLSERRAVEERLRALAAEEAALLERARLQEFQERFLAILGHDLRNPLAAIDMGIGLLQRGPEPAAARRLLGRMETSSRRMTRMIEQILDLTRSRLGGGLPIQPKPMELAPMLHDVVEEARAGRPERMVELVCPRVDGRWDRDRLEQVFSNLVGNALSYGAATTPVRVYCHVERETVHVDVFNEGPTIPEELREKIFDPFRRGEREGREKGTEGLGLGLYISRELVLAHGGDIRVRSTAGEGTTFRVSLPRASVTSVERRA